MQLINEVLAEGVRCLSLPDSRFKTSRLTVALLLPLKKETASAGALLPYLLRRSCAAYPDFTALQRRLNELYGASITAEVARIGEAQALVLTAAAIDDRFALAGEPVAESCAALLRQMLFEPVLENGCFRASDVRTEKRCLIERMEAEINDKRWYARRRCEELLCENEAYAVDRYGSPEAAAALTPESLTGTWRRVLAGARVQLILQGGAAVMHAAGPLREALAGVPGRKPLDCPTVTAASYPAVRERVERMEVRGSKLVLGFRAGTAEPDGDVAAARLMNALLGGTPHSLLFRNVREKLSLCYYCASSYDRLKGILLVDSGVDGQNARPGEGGNPPAARRPQNRRFYRRGPRICPAQRLPGVWFGGGLTGRAGILVSGAMPPSRRIHAGGSVEGPAAVTRERVVAAGGAGDARERLSAHAGAGRGGIGQCLNGQN